MSNWSNNRSDDDFRNELASHLEEEVERQMKQRGLDEANARFAARRTFGNVLGAVERFHESRRWAWTERITQHVRYAVRALGQHPAFAVTAIGSLAIGIGFMTAIFTIFYALVFRGLPVPDASRLVNVYQILQGDYNRGVHGTGSWISYLEYRNYVAAIDSARRTGGSALASAAVYAPAEWTAETRNGELRGEYVSCNYFGVAGVRLEKGRGFTPDECAHVGDPAVVVLSHAQWQGEFGADSAIIGRRVRINQVPFSVVGVAPPGYMGMTILGASAWMPVTMQPAVEHGRDSLVVQDWSWMIMAARLVPGASAEQARAQLTVTAAQRDRALNPKRKTVVVVSPAALLNFPEVKREGALAAGFITLLGVVLVAMVCANIMNLLLARGVARRREIGIRLAIGASRARLVEQLLTEASLIALLGAAAGYALAYVLPPLLPRLIPVSDLQVNLAPDGRILVATIVVALVTAIVFGLVPALHATNMDLASAAKGAMATRAGHVRTSRLRSAIVGVQVGGSAILLVVSALFVRAVSRAALVDPGYVTDNVVSFKLNLNQLGYSPERRQATMDMLRDRIGATPGVMAQGYVWPLPLLGRRTEPVVPLSGRAHDRREIPDVNMANVTPGVIDALQIRIVKGRNITAAEADNASDQRAAVISETLAQLLVPDGEALGSVFRVDDRTYHVVGVAADTRYISLAQDHETFVYMPPSRRPSEDLNILARTSGSPAQLERLVPLWGKEIDPGITVQTQRMSERVEMELRPVKLASLAAGAIGALAMLLALVGIYGVVSYAVSQQTREIAIRQALGATRRGVLQFVMRQGSRPVVVGLIVAMAVSLGLAQVMRKLLFGINPLDPLSYAGVLVLLSGASILAMYGPARRATRISPAVALRED
ncbi:MAG TPA: ADOP family duplicated permease [Gemmatimonadaceae bacterium]|nr:ADOP family duplicated permease [Gemmatimonadaceae bacterium]